MIFHFLQTTYDWMATPFPSIVALHDPIKGQYQNEFIQARIHGEQAFGVIKRRFRILQALPFRQLSKCEKAISVFLAIHNFLLSQENVDEVSFL